MESMTRLFVTSKDKIQDNITNGIINTSDLVITTDTHELLFVENDGSQINLTEEDSSPAVKAAITTLQNQVSGLSSAQNAMAEAQSAMQERLDIVEENVQPDWTETDTESDAYIRHKPFVPSETSHMGIGFGSCYTALATPNKTVTIPEFILKANGIIAIRFTNGFNSGDTLNVNNTGASYVYYHGSSIGNGVIRSGTVALMIYDGTRWQLLTTDTPLITSIGLLTSSGGNKRVAIATSSGTIFEVVPSSIVGVAGGVASLNSSGVVPSEQLDITDDMIPESVARVADVNEALNLKANTADLPTKVSQFENDSNYQTGDQVDTSISNAVANKVDKVTGKGLSTNDYTTAEKNKLAGIEANATNTTIDSTLTIADDAADAKAVGDELSETTRTYDSNTAIIPERVNDDGTFSPSSTNSRTDYVDLSGALGYSLSESMSITVNYYDVNKVYLESKYFSVGADELINTPTGVGYVIVNGSNAKMEGLRVNVTKNTFKKYVDDEINELKEDVNGKLSAPLVAGSQGQVLTSDGEGGSSWENPTGGGGTVTDIQVNGTSIVTNGVADIPIASNVNGISELGLVKINSAYGITSDRNGVIVITKASQGYVKGGSQKFTSIVPFNQHESTFYGLTKAAGVDMASSSNPVGTYTSEAKAAIQQMLGIDSAIADAIGDITSIEFQVVQELPVTGAKGVIYLIAHTHGEKDIYDEYIWLTDKYEKLGSLDVDLSNYVTFDDISVKDVQINDVSIVDSETGVANVPLADDDTAGAVKTNVSAGITVSSLGSLTLVPAGPPIIKAGTATHNPIAPSRQHQSVFYGLAKAAGDTTQSQSSNAVGTYTDEAKAAIKDMLEISGECQTVTVSETAPTIQAMSNTRYVCGEVSTLDFTPSAKGVCDVIFTSGATPTVLTLPSTVILPSWFDATALDADTTYEISISDGVYGAVMSW